MSRFDQPFLSRFCMFCAYARPRYQVSVYRTIGPLVLYIIKFTFLQVARIALITLIQTTCLPVKINNSFCMYDK